MKIQNNILKVHEDDNVAVSIIEEGLKKGEILDKDITLLDDIPFGHKIALTDLKKNDPIIRYGTIIGYAADDINIGQWVSEQLTQLVEPIELDKLPMATKKNIISRNANKKYTFMGYKNEDGTVGTKNILGILPTVQCVAGTANKVVAHLKQEYLPKYPNVDDIVALNHTYGCGVAINAPAAIVPIRTLSNLAMNPNLGGEVILLSLGCEKLQAEMIVPPFIESQENWRKESYAYLQDPDYVGYENIFNHLIEMAVKKLEKLNQRSREECTLADLRLGMQCGGSDAFSGMTANPVLGYAADIIVAEGGMVMFSEVTEVRDAINQLTERAADESVAQALIKEMQDYDDYLAAGQVDRSSNTTPGNKKGGLNNITEKALGSIAKSGTSIITDVLSPGERIKKNGLVFHATPASDFICGTLQMASGINMQVFTTGRGTPYNLALVPVVKISSNSKLYKQWFDIIDFDAGIVVSEQKTIADVAHAFLEFILKIASGEQPTNADRLGLVNDLALFNPAPVT